MKVSDNITPPISTIMINGTDFNDLTSKQIGTIRAIVAGRVTYDDISERMLETVEELQLTGLVTKSLELTPTGRQVIDLAAVLGGSKERRRAATLDMVEVNDEDVYVDDYAEPIDIEANELFRMNSFGR